MSDAKGLAQADRDVMLRLQEPIPPEAIDTRPGRGGKQFRYITAETLMERLDAVVGPENWSNDIAVDPKGGWVRHTLTIALPSGKVIMRSGIADIAYEDDRGQKKDFPFKTAETDSMKRAGQRAGVARDLYEDPEPHHDYDRPQGGQQRPQAGGHGGGQRPQGQAQGGGGVGPPRNGKALFAFASGKGALDWFTGWGKHNDLPGRMVDWPDDAAQAAYADYQQENPPGQPRQGRPAPAAPGTRNGPPPQGQGDDDVPW